MFAKWEAMLELFDLFWSKSEEGKIINFEFSNTVEVFLIVSTSLA